MLMKSRERELIIALNKLIWKVPCGIYEDSNDFARYIITELIDIDIRSIKWDKKTQEFYSTKKRKHD